MRRLIPLLCICVVIPVLLAGCGGDKNIKDSPYADVPLVDAAGNDISHGDARELYQAGHAHLLDNDTDKALRALSAVQDRYPFTDYATQAAMETVTAHYLAGDYAKAVSTADRFIKQHPRHAHIDYMYYLRGLSNFHRNDPGLVGGALGVNPDLRNRSHLKQAFSDFKRLIRNNPDSLYANDARQHMLDIRNRLADFELTVAEYYRKRKAWVAAARRSSYIIRHYQGAPSVPRALEIMQEAYIHLQLPVLARDTRAILQASYPDYIVHRTAFYNELEQPPESDAAEGGSSLFGLGKWLPWIHANKTRQHTQSKAWLSNKPSAIIGSPASRPEGQKYAPPAETRGEKSEQGEGQASQTDQESSENPWLNGTATHSILSPEPTSSSKSSESGGSEDTTRESSEKRSGSHSSGGSNNPWLKGGPSQTIGNPNMP